MNISMNGQLSSRVFTMLYRLTTVLSTSLVALQQALLEIAREKNSRELLRIKPESQSKAQMLLLEAQIGELSIWGPLSANFCHVSGHSS